LTTAGDPGAGAGAADVHGGDERLRPEADGRVPQPEPFGAVREGTLMRWAKQTLVLLFHLDEAFF